MRSINMVCALILVVIAGGTSIHAYNSKHTYTPSQAILTPVTPSPTPQPAHYTSTPPPFTHLASPIPSPSSPSATSTPAPTPIPTLLPTDLVTDPTPSPVLPPLLKLPITIQPTDPVSENGLLTGTIYLSPTCPYISIPPTYSCRAPYSATVLVKSADQSRIIDQFTSQEDGMFSKELPAGNYILVPLSPPNLSDPYILSDLSSNRLGSPHSSPLPITIKPGETTSLIITYDSGIR